MFLLKGADSFTTNMSVSLVCAENHPAVYMPLDNVGIEWISYIGSSSYLKSYKGLPDKFA
jgi:hypothetical protein